MSVRVMSEVWDQSEAEGGSLLVLLALADWANDERKCWPKTETLARKARLSTRQLSRILQQLADAGEIVVPSGPRSQDRPYQIRQYVVSPCVADHDQTRMADSAHAGDDAVSKPPEGTTTAGEQGSLVPEPADELFVRWQRTFERWDAKFTPARRRAALKAIKEEPNLDALEEAMRGFKSYRDRKPGGIELGDIFGTFAGTGDLRSRIEWARRMAGESSGTGVSVNDLMANLPIGGRDIVELRMERVRAMVEHPDNQATHATGQEALRLLREAPPRCEPVIIDGKLAGWRRAT